MFSILFGCKEVPPDITTSYTLALVSLNMMFTRGCLMIIPGFRDTFCKKMGILCSGVDSFSANFSVAKHLILVAAC